MENSEPLDGLLSGYTHRTLKEVRCVKTDFRLACRERFRYGTGLKAKNEGGKKEMFRTTMVTLLFGCLMVTAPALADDITPGGSASAPQDQALATLQAENAQLSRKVAELEAVPGINQDALAAKSRQRLREIAADVKSQCKSLADFESFVTWMSGNLSGYSRYI